MSELRQGAGYYRTCAAAWGRRTATLLLGQFISWLEDHGAVTITTADALAWVTLPAGASSSWLAFRMRAVRGFARYLRTLDPAAEVPPPGVLPGRIRRAVPYLYSGADIAALIAQAQQLRTPLRRATIGTLIGLMAVVFARFSVPSKPRAGREE
jgi:hypothetical protein